MEEINATLGLVVGRLSDENYAQSLDFYRFWFGIAQTYHQIPSDQIFDTIWENRETNSINVVRGPLIHPTAHLIVRLASDAESDNLLAPYSSGIQNRLCTRSLQQFFSDNLSTARRIMNGYADQASNRFCVDTTLIAHWANLGYMEESAIRSHILQSLISHPTFYDHQADALIILFKLAGATFEVYADPSVVDRCFELLKGHCYAPPYSDRDQRYREYHGLRGELRQVRESA